MHFISVVMVVYTVGGHLLIRQCYFVITAGTVCVSVCGWVGISSHVLCLYEYVITAVFIFFI